MTENYGIEGWNSPSIFFFLVPDKQWGLLWEEVLFSVLYILIFGGGMLIKYVFFEYNP